MNVEGEVNALRRRVDDLEHNLERLISQVSSLVSKLQPLVAEREAYHRVNKQLDQGLTG